ARAQHWCGVSSHRARRVWKSWPRLGRARVKAGADRRLLPLSSPDLVPLRIENELMLRGQAGDLGAFEPLGERCQSMVYGLALSLWRTPEDAEEAAQAAFVKLFRARSQFDGTRDLEPWLLRIAGNACSDRLRRRRASSLPLLEDKDGDDITQHLPDANS